jgi:putative membrane protein
MQMVFKGIITGIIIILPGMSGGTLLLLLGLYEKLVADLSRLRILPWLPFVAGAAGGILVSGAAFSWLLGCILASIRAVLGEHYRPNYRRVLLFLLGAAIGFILAGEPMSMVEDTVRPGIGLLLIGGALACAAMILPGVPGSSVLIIMGIYDDMLQALADFDWRVLMVFVLGAAIGAFGLSNALDNIYSRYRASISWLFSGLILGSARMLIPGNWDNPLPIIILAAAGFALVWWWGEK